LSLSLSKIILVSLWNPKVHYCVHKSPPVDPMWVQTRGALKHFVTNYFFTVRGWCPHAQPSSWRTTPCRLSAIAYSIYSQLPSVSGGLPFICNLRTRHSVVTRTHLTWVWFPLTPLSRVSFFKNYFTITSPHKVLISISFLIFLSHLMLFNICISDRAVYNPRINQHV